MTKKTKVIPKFKNEDLERKFWDNADLSDYFDFSKSVKFDLSALKPSARTVTLRVPETLLYMLKKLANKKDVPYQSLMKIYLTERIESEYAPNFSD